MNNNIQTGTKEIPISPVNHELFLGNLRAFSGKTLDFLIEPKNLELPIYRLELTSFFDVVVVNDLDILHEMLIKHAASFHQVQIVTLYVGNTVQGLNTEDNPEHMKHRVIESAFFTPDLVQSYRPLILAQTTKFISKWKAGDEMNLFEEMARITISVIAKIVFTDDLGEDFDHFTEMIKKVQDEMELKVHSNSALIPHWIPTHENNEINKVIKEIDTFMRNLITKRRNSANKKNDLFQVLVDTATNPDGSKLTDDQIVHHSILLLIAGHETSSGMLTASVLNIFRDKYKYFYDKTIEDLKNGSIAKVQELINESLRVYPPIWSMLRTPIGDVQVGEYLLKKGTIILIPIFAINRNIKYFPDGNEFKPESWEGKTGRNNLMSFGMGEHFCIGSGLAQAEGEVIISEVLKHLKMTPLSQEDPVLQATATVRTKDPVIMKIDEIVA